MEGKAFYWGRSLQKPILLFFTPRLHLLKLQAEDGSSKRPSGDLISELESYARISRSLCWFTCKRNMETAIRGRLMGSTKSITRFFYLFFCSLGPPLDRLGIVSLVRLEGLPFQHLNWSLEKGKSRSREGGGDEKKQEAMSSSPALTMRAGWVTLGQSPGDGEF
uniref:Uncharacterized protein n=1 Tax=Micrurus corallinus TaxID=54390 RepID=A0A2D4F1U9_MICCO